LLQLDQDYVWHPYTSLLNSPPVFPVASASGVRIKLTDGRELIDGMSSWWCAIHGYNHPVLNAAITKQLQAMAHVMFGGFTHGPAVALAERLVALTPAPLQTVFFSDSGSVAVEVAIKMAIQYWVARGQSGRKKLLTIRQGYHGDTFGAMAVCDPVTGMHSLFTGVLMQHYFADAPRTRFGHDWDAEDISSFRELINTHHQELAAVILEPIVQGAGGMWFYHPEYLRQVRKLCDEFDVLLILDEIATGFGRSGKLLACEHAGINPDIMCVGKALTGGYLTLAATLTTRAVAETISDQGQGVFMHGPTFMANPLACAVALASIDLLLAGPWQDQIQKIEMQLKQELEPCRHLANVVDVRVLGAIGVVELNQPVDMHTIPKAFVDRGVWVRPFGRLVYLMPPYIIDAEDLNILTTAVHEVVKELHEKKKQK
ncbi:MAG: adenosylmethionine--8-amino-7-oxononanoate transaminase, partial [Gammaproteobacteria bacterium]|nr:adenosylmethionine--8-amino-7-oxononanoate transaminase [Gammaproteobacteria bacterium]